MENSIINVVELFAGVGGFRKGLEECSPRFKTVWANQWEPGRKVQHAFDCYIAQFGESANHVNEDIALAKRLVPPHDLLVGGFPCQDYSVANSLSTAKGIEGKKGILWWDIHDIISTHHPNYVLLENVDRLLRSPAKQRGRDFGMILRCLHDSGYFVEWRMINAANYGEPQKRRRVFIFAFKHTSPFALELMKLLTQKKDIEFNWLTEQGFFAPTFPVKQEHHKTKVSYGSISPKLYKDLVSFSNNFKADFFHSGILYGEKFYTETYEPILSRPKTLGEILEKGEIASRFFLGENLEKWAYLKGSKRIERINPAGEKYIFSEGSIPFPDPSNTPARTMLTSESSVNRSTHVVEDIQTRELRLLTPIECERLNGFPDNWTNTGMPEKFRYFTMGNALVVPLIKKMGARLLEII